MQLAEGFLGDGGLRVVGIEANFQDFERGVVLEQVGFEPEPSGGGLGVVIAPELPAFSGWAGLAGDWPVG